MVKIGVVGLGIMGSSHAKAITQIPRMQLAAVSDIDSNRMGKFKGAAQFQDPFEMIESGTIDSILIATPHFQHTEVGIESLKAGLHVLVEKPISVHKADCEKLIAARQNSKQVFAAMLNQRTDPGFRKIKELVEQGELGEIQRVSWTITNWFRSDRYYKGGGWRATWGGEGGGVLLNQCPHNLDLLQWIVGMPSRIRAFASFGKFHDIEVEDEVTAFFEYPNGATGVFITSTGEAPGSNRLEIAGDRGRIVYDGGNVVFTKTEVSVKEFCRTTHMVNGLPGNAFTKIYKAPGKVAKIANGLQKVVLKDGSASSHGMIIKNFADAILDGVKPIAPAEEGIRSVELANAMLLSAWTNEPVDLPMDSAVYEFALEEKIQSSRYQNPFRVI